MMLVCFRSRLAPDAQAEYAPLAAEIAALASAQPGLLNFKTFAASDGKRVTLAEFENAEAVEAWRVNPRHQEAQQAGRERFYETYRVQVCEVVREYGREGRKDDTGH